MTFKLYDRESKKLSERSKEPLPPYQRIGGKEDGSQYIASEGLSSAVNVALALGQPLLLTGEPGTGKTRLANSIAFQFDLELHKFHTKSTSIARDLFYRYDSLRHFHDAQLKEKGKINTEDYIELEALGQAIVDSHKKRSVVLIDEIDKAPRDFPNDVLNELENMEFTIKETGQHYKVNEPNRPILVITSNSEKNLPDAFLRRCVFYHIPFPDKDMLTTIVNTKIPLSKDFRDNMLSGAIDYFLAIRKMGLRKKPATAELLAWIHVLNNLQLNPRTNVEAEVEQLKKTYSILAKTQEDLQKMTG
jgi:MoxR-like ATPase